MKAKMKNFRELVKHAIDLDSFTDDKCDIFDVISCIDEVNRNSVTDSQAIEIFKDLNYSSWDVTNDYVAHCESNFGSVQHYQGEAGVIPYKAFCLWFETLIGHNIALIFEDTEKEYSERQVARKIRSFLLHKDNKHIIQEHNF